MKTLAIAMFLVLASCSTDQQCDFVVDGLCVVTWDYQVSAEELSWEIAEVEAAVNKYFPGLDLAALIENKGLVLHFVEEGKMEGNRGDYSNDEAEYIRVQQFGLDDGEDIQCMQVNYVFGHELLHFIGRNYLNISDEDQENHVAHNLFLEMNVGNRLASDSAEYEIYHKTADYCGYDFR